MSFLKGRQTGGAEETERRERTSVPPISKEPLGTRDERTLSANHKVLNPRSLVGLDKRGG